MKGVFVLVLTIFAVVPSQSVPVKPCDGIAAPLSVEVEGCTELPCQYNRGDHVKFQYKFVVPSYTSSLKPLVKATYYGLNHDNDPKVEGCNNLVGDAKCPLEANTTVIYKVDRKVEWYHPATDINLKYSLENQKGETIVCYNLPIKVNGWF